VKSRTTFTTVTFSRPFVLSGVDGELPAGSYEVETDEELLEGLSFPVYRRKLTMMHLKGKPGQAILTRSVTIDPNELNAAIELDRASTSAGVEDDESVPDLSSKSDRQKADRQDLDRADDEGMVGPDDRGESPPKGSAVLAITAGLKAEMNRHGITRVPVDYFHYRDFRYTSLEDAVAQARRDHGPS